MRRSLRAGSSGAEAGAEAGISRYLSLERLS